MAFNLPNRPKFVYDSGTTLLLSIPQRLWKPLTNVLGGGREDNENGVVSVWPGVRHYGHELRIRCTEDEWPDLRSALIWAIDTGSAIDIYLDQDVSGTKETVYLIAPTITDDLIPEPGDPDGYEITIRTRTTNRTPVDVNYRDG